MNNEYTDMSGMPKMNNEYTDMSGMPSMNNEYTDMTGMLEMPDGIKGRKSKKGIVIALIVIVLAGAGVLAYFLVFGSANSPESVVKHDMEAVMNNDYKSIIKNMTDEEFDMLAIVNEAGMTLNKLSTGEELRSWAMHQVENRSYYLSDKIISYKIEKVTHMSVSKYIDDYLGGYGYDEYYSFLDRQDEIAVVVVRYVVDYNGEEREVTETISTYKNDGKWYSLSGIQLVDRLLEVIE